MRRAKPTNGFTLVEMTVVLVIVGLVILTVYPALTVTRMSAQRSLTNANLQALMRATAAYVQANGCLPCPAPPNATSANFGRVGTSAACGSCSSLAGLPPFVSLGIPMNVAHDGWNRWITMAIDTTLAQDFGVKPPTLACTATDVADGTCAQEGLSQKGLCQSGLSTANSLSVKINSKATVPAAVVLVSHGANGYGSFFASPTHYVSTVSRMNFPSSALDCAGGGYEQCNIDSTTTFADTAQVIGDYQPFDDVLLYADRNGLVSYLGNPACQTPWPPP